MTKFSDVPPEFMASAVYLGIDQSLNHTGLSFENAEGEIICCTMPPPPELSPIYRLNWLHGQFVALGRLPLLRMVAMEGYSFGSKFQLPQLGELGGVVRLALLWGKVPSITCSPSGVKKYVTGKGSATKAQVKAGVLQAYGIKTANDNEADAVTLGQIARAYDLNLQTSAVRRSVLDTVSVLVPKSAPAPRVRTRIIRG